MEFQTGETLFPTSAETKKQDSISMRFDRESVLRREEELNTRGRRRLSGIWLMLRWMILIAVVGTIASLCFVVYGGFQAVLDTAPDISNIDVTPTGFSTFVYDSDGNQTARLVSTDSNRIPVTLDMVPIDLQHAFVAIEDSRFYKHRGIDIEGILRAGVTGLTSGSFSQGASTITQQLIKNNVFEGWTNETFSESVRRKIQEQYLAVELEKTMSKDDILINYLNTINLGHSTLGVQAASLRYFGRSVSTLNLSECAVIAGITQNPTKYDPITYPENNNRRRLLVLDRMLDQGYITRQQHDEAAADNPYERIKIIDEETNDSEIQSYFVDALTEQVLSDLQARGYTEQQAYTLLYSGGLKIYSTQDAKIQKICDDVVADESNYPAGTRWYLQIQLSVQDRDGNVTNYSTEMFQKYLKENGIQSTLIFSSRDAANKAYEKYKASVVSDRDTVVGEKLNLQPQPQISLTVEDQHTGNVVAIVGGRGEKTANRTLNRAYDVVRQPGSTFKVVSTYAPALDSGGKTLASTQLDAPYTYTNGTPVRNWYGESYRGLSTVREGIQNSMNIVAVKTLTDITPLLGYTYLKDLGITTLVNNEEIGGQIFSDVQQTLALGGITKGVSNFALNGAYAAIANGGTYIEPRLYTKVTDHDGNVILGEDDRVTRRVLDEDTAWLLTSAMEDVVTKGTGTACQLDNQPVAGKTGTTSDENDVWFSGYTNYYTCTTWTGYDENTDLIGSEASYAKIIWKQAMAKIHENLPTSNFTIPSGIVEREVCADSGKLPVEGRCPDIVKEYFAEDEVPTQYCDIHFSGYICAETGLPAQPTCPYAVRGNATFQESGKLCPHDAAFMAKDDLSGILDKQKKSVAKRKAQEAAAAEEAARQQREAAISSQTEAEQAAVTSAEDTLNAANQTLSNEAATLKAAQDRLVAAREAGDQSQVDIWTAAVQQQTEVYNNAAAAVTSAQQQLDDAKTALAQAQETARAQLEGGTADTEEAGSTATSDGTGEAIPVPQQ